MPDMLDDYLQGHGQFEAVPLPPPPAPEVPDDGWFASLEQLAPPASARDSRAAQKPAAQAAPPAVAPLATINAQTLKQKTFEPLVSPVSRLIVEGLTLLCGASKIGKSWLVLQMCCAVAEGKLFLGRETMQGSVLYLALEDSERRLKSRLEKIGETPGEALTFATHAQSLDTGLLDQLNEWLSSAVNPRMIVIDTLQKVRAGIIPPRTSAYAADYGVIVRLKKLADEKHVAIVLVHHMNKMQNVEDPYEKISGSNGLMGAADTAILIFRERGDQDATVNITGRDVWEDEFTLRLVNCRWTPIDGEALEREQYEASPVPRTCRKLLETSCLDDGVVQIASSEFIEASYEFTGALPPLTSRTVYSVIEHIAPQLRKYDGIVIARKRVGSQNGLHISKAREAETA